uniref:hypothetical protein n=1 Tax=Thiolapillus sp. TaxID=2017437 RepID=UPI0025F23D20
MYADANHELTIEVSSVFLAYYRYQRRIHQQDEMAIVVVSATLKPLLFAVWRRSRWYQSDKLGLHNRIWSNGFNGD